MRNDTQAAASSVVAFLVAGVIFIGSVGAILVVSRDGSQVGDDTPASAAALSLQSQALADLMVTSPGYHWDGAQLGVGWDADTADGLTRLGLRSGSNATMDFEKFQNLRRAGLAANATDGLVNYPEALESLGLDQEGLDFHLRAFPSLKSVRDILASGEMDPNLRVTYVADLLKQSHGGSGNLADSLSVSTLTCTATGSKYTLNTTVTNNGDSTTEFLGHFEAELGSADEYEDRARSYEVAPGGTTVLSIDVPALAGRACSGQVELQLRDPKSKIAEFQWILGTGGTAPTTVTKDLWANPGKSYYNQGQAVVIEFEGDLPTASSPGSITLSLTVTQEDGTPVYTNSAITVTKNVRSVTVPASSFDAAVTHNYVATLSYPAAGVTVWDRVLVLPAGQTVAQFQPAASTVSYTATTPVAIEAGFIEDLVSKFCPYYIESTTSSPMAAADFHRNGLLEPVAPATTPQDTYSGRCAFKASTPLGAAGQQPGDIIPDQQDAMNNLLPARLIDPARTGYTQQCNGNIVGGPRFDITRVLVVGSNVDHNAMTSAAAKYAVCEWVMDGGTLIVFGSADQQVQWLQPIFHAAIASSSNPISTPDASHPILNRADALDYDGYDSRGQVWSFNGRTAAEQDELLTNVVAAGAADSILAVSNPGAFGDGTIILTTWLPYELFGAGNGTSEAEGLKVVNNFLMQGYRDLFLDYGPEIPTQSRQAAAAQRVVNIVHPEFTEPITLTLFVYVF